MKFWQSFLILVVLALFIGGAYYYKTNPPEEIKKENTNTKEKSESESGVSAPAEPQKINLSNVSNLEASGIANQAYSDKKFIQTISAVLPKASEGSFYQGWLFCSASVDNPYIDLGKLKADEDGGSHYVEFSSDNDYRNCNKISVTLEKVDDNKPEQAILEGTF